MHISVTACLGVLLLGSVTAHAETRFHTGIDQDAALPYWQISDQGMAKSCVFQTVFKNVSNLTQASALDYNLHDWVVRVAGRHQGLKVREDWKREWQRRKVKPAAQLAFEWSLYPTQQVYKSGDYNWGMSIFNLKPGTKFDLQVVWHQYGQTRSATIKDIQCAADIHPDPASARQP
jgi:hypothetical protein